MARWVVLAGCSVVLLAHLFVLLATGQNPLISPISQLSAGDLGFVHTAGLVAFAVAHLGLWSWLGPPGPIGRLWRTGRALLLANALLLVTVAAYFALASPGQLAGTNANDPLSLLASVTGLCMGLLARGLGSAAARSVDPASGHAESPASQPAIYRFNLACMLVWLALLPLVLLVDKSWLGGYERLVGGVFILWVAGLAIGYPEPDRRHGKTTRAEPGTRTPGEPEVGQQN